MSDLLCWLKKSGVGRPKIERERTRINFMLDNDLHEALLALAGSNNCSITDALNMSVAVGLPVLAFHPELISTLRTKFVQNPKNAEES